MAKKVYRWYSVLIEDKQQPAYGADLDVYAAGPKDALVKTLIQTENNVDPASFKRKKGKDIEFVSRELRVRMIRGGKGLYHIK